MSDGLWDGFKSNGGLLFLFFFFLVYWWILIWLVACRSSSLGFTSIDSWGSWLAVGAKGSWREVYPRLGRWILREKEISFWHVKYLQSVCLLANEWPQNDIMQSLYEMFVTSWITLNKGDLLQCWSSSVLIHSTIKHQHYSFVAINKFVSGFVVGLYSPVPL